MHDAGAHVCVAISRAPQPACVFGLMIYFFFSEFFFIFSKSGEADIEMDGPYALYGRCIFHIAAAKWSRLYGQDVALGRGPTL